MTIRGSWIKLPLNSTHPHQLRNPTKEEKAKELCHSDRWACVQSGWEGATDESHLGDGASGVLECMLPLPVSPDWSKGKGPACPFWACHIPRGRCNPRRKQLARAASVPVTYWGDLCTVLSLFFFLFPLGIESRFSQQSGGVMTTRTNKSPALQLRIKGQQTPLQKQLQSRVTSEFVLLITFWLAFPGQANWKEGTLCLSTRVNRICMEK